MFSWRQVCLWLHLWIPALQESEMSICGRAAHRPSKTAPDIKGPMEARGKMSHPRHSTCCVARRVEDGRALPKTCDTGFMGQTSVESTNTRDSFTCIGPCEAERKNCESVETVSFCDVLHARMAAARMWGCVKSRSKACHRAELPGFNLRRRKLPFVHLLEYQFRGGTEPTATRQRPVTILADCVQEVNAVLFLFLEMF